MYMQQVAKFAYRGGGTFSTLLAYLKTFGTPIVFAPYYDTARTSTRTNDLAGGADYLTLTGAVFDSTDHQAMKFDGIDDYASGNVSYSTAGCVSVSAVSLLSAGAAQQRICGWCPPLLQGNVTPFIFQIVSSHWQLIVNQGSGIYAVPEATEAPSPACLIGSWNKTNAIMRYNATDVAPVAASNDMVSVNYGIRISSANKTDPYAGSVHLLVAYIPSQTIAQANALWADRATLYALVKAAFPWVTLP